MVKKPKSEYEFRDQLRERGWYTLLTGGSLSCVDLMAIKRKKKLFAVKAFQIKETNKKCLYLNEQVLEQIQNFEARTGIPVQLAVKFKMGLAKKEFGVVFIADKPDFAYEGAVLERMEKLGRVIVAARGGYIHKMVMIMSKLFKAFKCETMLNGKETLVKS